MLHCPIARRHSAPSAAHRKPTRLEVPTPYGHVPMHYPAMQAFSTLPNLRELSVDVRFEDMDSHVPCRGGFAALESFCLTRGSLPDIEEALQMVASSHLRRLKITILMSVDAQRLTTFLDGIRHAAIGITSLWLHLDCLVYTTTPLGPAELPEPVFSLHDLQELICRFKASSLLVTLSDRDISPFAIAWPDLRVLKLHEGGYSRSDAGSSVSALFDLALRCPRLESILFRHLHA
ncbi:hypothetical protein K466DRAFT_599628 [Polyporus arcularius HHB13444]|uniref:F-box domain-containing protein n=1 Tax=Polyporus arcularius HHB13444 TaxID=1314778 RepID=A0A5C3PEB9_9APHY|nr:hypothetical protein K466DRAFT_599628 [Polyporus arcularius HHB13444]